MTAISIETGIPLPEKGAKKYPLSQMGVGDSFTLPKSRQTAVRAAISSYRKNGGAGRSYAVRTVAEDTVRIWRTN